MFSVLFLGETLSAVQIVGGLLILGSTFVGENHQGPAAEREKKGRRVPAGHRILTQYYYRLR